MINYLSKSHDFYFIIGIVFDMNGSYVLMIELKDETTICIGKLGCINFPASWYVYVGSALHGIEHRVKRHFSQNKKHHWHIDYFLNHASLHQAYFKENLKHEECDIAQLFSKRFSCIPSFGSSDCRCKSHLFYGGELDLKETIRSAKMTLVENKDLI